MPFFNNFNLDNWKDSEIWTDSLWIIPERDKTGKHDGFYHGNFVPQIPRQLISRYTKKNEVVFDPFVGSGTTAYEAESLGRHFIGIDIQPELVKYVKNKVDNKIVVCLPCSKQVHALHSNYELKRKFDTLDKLKQDERVQKWIRWRRKHSRIEDIRYSQKEN